MKQDSRVSHEERATRRQLIAREVDSGIPQVEVARRHGVCLDTVYRACLMYGARKVRSTKPSTYTILAELLNTADSIRAIARRAKVTPQRVGEILTQARAAGIRFSGRKDNRRANS